LICRDCPRYDSDAERCRDGKVNPESWENAVSVSQIMGLRSICIFNDYRERLIAARRPFPDARTRPR
jgi:hypothetical protein